LTVFYGLVICKRT